MPVELLPMLSTSASGAVMIRVTEGSGFRSWNSGPCHVAADVTGWFQRIESPGRVALEVGVSQSYHGVFGHNAQQYLTAKVDSGSPVTVMSWTEFESRGFELPSSAPTTLRYGSAVASRERLRGWANVPMRVTLPHRLYGEKLDLPSCRLSVVVAINVAPEKFLLGLDFLSNYTAIFTRERIVVLPR